MAEQTKLYDFNSTGITKDEENKALPTNNINNPIGISTPVRQSQGGSALFQMNVSLEDQIKDNFRNMISTNHGERLMLGDFGGNLKPLAYELGSEDADAAAITRISKTTSKYMPFINLSTFETVRKTSQDGDLTRVGVRVSFFVPQLNSQLLSIEAVILSAG